MMTSAKRVKFVNMQFYIEVFSKVNIEYIYFIMKINHIDQMIDIKCLVFN